MNTKRILTSIAVFTILSGTVPVKPIADIINNMAITANAEEEQTISIDRRYLKVGESIVVNNPLSLNLKYYVDDNYIDSNNFILKSDYFEKWIRVEAYDQNDELVSSDSVYFSNLPVIYIDTEDGERIVSKDEYKNASMIVQNTDNIDDFVYSGEIKIKGRGHSSWYWKKKPYKIKLDKKTDLFGMGKNKHWVLLANYLDESLLRNTTAFQVSNQLGLETMDTIWADVVINGDYVGNYQLCEQIRVDDERVNIKNWEDEAGEIASAVSKAEKKKGNVIDKDALEELLTNNLEWISSGKFIFNKVEYTVQDYYDLDEDISGGYLFELSDEYNELSKFTTNNQLKVMVSSPEYLYTSSEMMDYVQSFWNNFESAYMSEDGYVTTEYGDFSYTQLADLDSMISYWLVMEIMGNNDAVYKSRYAYKDTGLSLIFGPVWDFDWGCGSAAVGAVATGWKVTKSENNQNFYREWVDDPLFICKAVEKYWSVRPFLEDLIKTDGIIDQETEYLMCSGIADEDRWDRKITWPTSARGFENDTILFKQFLKDRISWLDEQFQTDTTLLNSLYYDKSKYPYIKSEEIDLSVKNSYDISDELAENIIGIGDNLQLLIDSKDDSTDAVNVYINGIYYDNVPLIDSKAELTIANELLTSEDEKINVVSVIGKDNLGKTTYKNYTTVKEAMAASVQSASLSGVSAVLDDNIKLEFYMNLPDDIAASDNVNLVFSVENMMSNKFEVLLDKSKIMEINGIPNYIFECEIPAKNIHSNIYAKLRVGEIEVPIGNNIPITVAKYVKELKNVYPIKYDGIVDALITYGENAAAYWNIGEIKMNTYTNQIFEEIANKIGQNICEMEMSYYGSSLLLKSGTILRHYYTENADGRTEKDGYYYIDEVVPAHMYSSIDKYCVNDYIYKVLSSEETSDNLKNLCVALYNYGKAAEDVITTGQIILDEDEIMIVN